MLQHPDKKNEIEAGPWKIYFNEFEHFMLRLADETRNTEIDYSTLASEESEQSPIQSRTLTPINKVSLVNLKLEKQESKTIDVDLLENKEVINAISQVSLITNEESKSQKEEEISDFTISKKGSIQLGSLD